VVLGVNRRFFLKGLELEDSGDFSLNSGYYGEPSSPWLIPPL
jgi:hypothetical protein